MSKELIIYCDESQKYDRFFSNFYGGALISSENLQYVTKTLENKKIELNLNGEIKWTKITENYSHKYIEILQCFFDLISRDLIKVRIMFTKNEHIAEGLTDYHHEHQYYLLYYQFIKHAFGLQYAEVSETKTNIRVYLDEFPDTVKKQVQFKSYLANLSKDKIFRKKGLIFNAENITHVKSHDHVILQCVDIVLGAIWFRLNDHHKDIPAGKKRRGKRAIAKEKAYKHISKLIRTINPTFNIGLTTSTKMNIRNIWIQSYRHWLFIPKNFSRDKEKSKRKKIPHSH